MHCETNSSNSCFKIYSEILRKKEYFPVGCIPNAAVVILFWGGGGSDQTPHWVDTHSIAHTPVNRQTPVKTLPSPILRVRSVENL